MISESFRDRVCWTATKRIGAAALVFFTASCAVENTIHGTPGQRSVERITGDDCKPSDDFEEISLPGGNARLRAYERNDTVNGSFLGYLCVRLESTNKAIGIPRKMGIEADDGESIQRDAGDFSYHTDFVIVDPETPTSVSGAVEPIKKTTDGASSIEVSMLVKYKESSDDEGEIKLKKIKHSREN